MLKRTLATLACLGGLASAAWPQEGFLEETFSLYGYVVEFANVNLYSEDGQVTGSDWGNVLYGRLKGDWNPGERLAFHAELAYRAAVGNQNPYVVFENWGLGGLVYGDYPLVDFQQSVEVDHLWGSLALGPLDVQFGKLPLAWGTGYFFNPTSRASVAAFLDTVSEETPGTLAVLPSLSLRGGRLSLQGYAAFQDKTHTPSPLGADGRWGALPFGLRLQGIVGSFDLSTSWIREVRYVDPAFGGPGLERTHYWGADLVGAIWNFGVYAEAALKVRDESSDRWAFQEQGLRDLLEACVGFDYLVPLVEVDTRVEYYHQGSGVRRPADYDVNRILGGEQVVLGEDYLLLYLERSFLDYFRVSAAGLVNLNDGSVGLVPELGGEPYANLEVALGAVLLFGPPGSEFDGNYPGYDLTEPAIYLRCKLSF